MKCGLLAVVALVLAACGGGGSGHSGDAAPPFGLGPRAAPVASFPPCAVPSGAVAFERAFPGLSLHFPLAVATAPGDATHLYVARQGGLINVFEARDDITTAEAAVFLDLSDRTRANGEQGLLGMAFDPNYASNGYVYVNYSASAGLANNVPADSVIARFTANPATHTADRTSEVQLLRFTQPYLNHNGGGLAFGPDGMLYIASGDGGSSNDPSGNAQNLGTVLGKILRIAPDGSVPADNPFVGTSGARGEIWAYGLRNPFRFSFDRADGRLWAGDVGQNAIEEIDLVTRGGNYGWRAFEGTRCNTVVPGNSCSTDPNPPPEFIPPLFQYAHDDQGGVSITGGLVYRGSRFPDLVGRYLYGDFGSGRIWSLAESGGTFISNTQLSTECQPVSGPTSFGEGLDGEPLITAYLDYVDGGLFRLKPATNSGSDSFPETLSATGLFSDLAAPSPAAGVVPYEPNAPFWSDGATKRRWIAVPDGQAIEFSATGNWTFPVGTITVKHFEILLADQHTVKRLETRVFVRQASGWQGYTYRWRDDGSDADLLPGAASVTLQTADGSGGARTQTYEFPGRTQCLQCHTAATGFALGLRTSQLNGRYTYPNGVTDNQLRALDHAGYFTGDIGSPSDYAASTLPDPYDPLALLSARTRAYLDSNCAQCHQPDGGTPVDMDLRAATAIGSTQTVGVLGTEGAVGGATLRIAAGSKAASLIWTRMNATSETERMPPIATHVIDAAGLDLIGQWIDAGAN